MKINFKIETEMELLNPATQEAEQVLQWSDDQWFDPRLQLQVLHVLGQDNENQICLHGHSIGVSG